MQKDEFIKFIKAMLKEKDNFSLYKNLFKITYILSIIVFIIHIKKIYIFLIKIKKKDQLLF